MSFINNKQDAIVISEYCSIINQIVNSVEEISLIKLYAFSFICYRIDYHNWSAYSGKDSVDVLYKCISCMAGSFDEFSNHLKYIIASTDLLKKNNLIKIQGNYAINIKGTIVKLKENKHSNLSKAILASKTISDRQFLKEVLRNV